MLTLIDAICIAGDRAAQNDDAWALGPGRACVIDGATDLHDAPLMAAASDAAWLAQVAAQRFARRDDEARTVIGAIAQEAGERFRAVPAGAAAERWMWPTAAILIAEETPAGLRVTDLGDCRAFARDAAGAALAAGGSAQFKAGEAASAAKLAGGGGNARYKSAQALELLRAQREQHNVEGGYWVLGIDPACAAHARETVISLNRPAHVLLCTDGFSALVDLYEAYDPAGLIDAALTKGLAALAVELRAIETADDAGAKHPRWKRSDDATAVLLRLE